MKHVIKIYFTPRILLISFFQDLRHLKPVSASYTLNSDYMPRSCQKQILHHRREQQMLFNFEASFCLQCCCSCCSRIGNKTYKIQGNKYVTAIHILSFYNIQGQNKSFAYIYYRPFFKFYRDITELCYQTFVPVLLPILWNT